MAEIEVPSFDYSAFYYPKILQALIAYKRANVPEFTDESDHEPLMHALKAFACVGHLNNVLLDVVANEFSLPTAKLPETVRNLLRLIDYEMSPATPSQTPVLFKLNQVLTASTEVVPVRGQVSTKRGNGDVPVIYFEALDGLTCPATDSFGAVYSATADETFEDHTSAANAGSSWSPWSGTAEAGACIYFGHAECLWDKLNFDVTGAASISDGVWEFYDGDSEDTNPDSVTDLGGGELRFDLTTLLGIENREGAIVRVTVLSTGNYEEVASTWNGSANVVTTGLISQTSASTDVEDYAVGTEWQEMIGVVDDTANLMQDGDVSYDLPQDGDRDWQKTTVNGFEGYFIRYRVIGISDPAGPSLGLTRMDTDGTNQYVIATVTQGRSVVGEVLGSSSGEESQVFETVNDYFISESEVVYVDSEEWTRVDNFLSSTSQDTHYVVKLTDDDKATITFGDGTNGKVPPIGQANLTIDYRHNAEEDGNVGASTITVDKTGLRFVSSLTNPEQAIGWAEAESASTESLERAKIAGPASIRTINVALGPDETEDLVEAYTDSNGSKLFERAVAIEEGYGPKTILIVVVPRGGGLATTAQLEELETYLNGDKTSDPVVSKKIIANQQAVAANYTQRAISFNATVEAPSAVTAQSVLNQLATLLQPGATKSDGVTWVWTMGGVVPAERIVHEIFNTDSRIRNVNVDIGDTQLGTRELPTMGTVVVSIVSSI